ncbi:hypothetical protein ACJX0J_031488, partial [Zea mays]
TVGRIHDYITIAICWRAVIFNIKIIQYKPESILEGREYLTKPIKKSLLLVGHAVIQHNQQGKKNTLLNFQFGKAKMNTISTRIKKNHKSIWKNYARLPKSNHKGIAKWIDVNLDGKHRDVIVHALKIEDIP